MTRAVILFGHGSRDPLWRAPMDAVAERVAAQGLPVRCAFLELQPPDLATAAAELAEGGATQLTIVPMFLGMGRHAREDLPRLVQDLQRLRPGLQVHVRPAVGEDPRVLELLASIAGA
ncbi:sirohydrochlorin chelatase [Ramlibacter albus]|uniref:CbiX/SirB N-terminal domain-containing protein n=1 Tax=Ramlibacter albus TaxID=2079448 RepID=A0A923M5H5_9BURK|nr:CbiX/SirB N-terminal domain-containing protein [Ramlibacter albus]MBC5764310.1 CbiX/SirB N-terminal domain-containing protein [Ramlibacter albus]